MQWNLLKELTLYNEHLSRSKVGNNIIMNKVHLFLKDKIMASSLERFHCRYVMCIFTLNCSYGLLYTECKELKMILHGHNTRAKMLWIEYHKYIMWFMKQLDFFFDRSVKPIIWVLISHLIVTGSIQIHCTCTCY